MTFHGSGWKATARTAGVDCHSRNRSERNHKDYWCGIAGGDRKSNYYRENEIRIDVRGRQCITDLSPIQQNVSTVEDIIYMHAMAELARWNNIQNEAEFVQICTDQPREVSSSPTSNTHFHLRTNYDSKSFYAAENQFWRRLKMSSFPPN